MSDLIRKLEHDHEESLQRLTRLLHELLAQTQDPHRALSEIHVNFLEALDEMCLEVDHFAMEETSLFPAILAVLPSLGPLVDEVQRSHQALDGLVAQLGVTLQPGPVALQSALPELTDLIQRFLAEFTRHAQQENILLRRAQRELTEEQKATLVALISDPQ
ncbi:MAG: hemerythrin domain-containing protein [Myxococcales bacterium]|nr:hemerythrin domain-containing protein [Polyangiaceae bacterium]MDW8250394.1 hemerythrin domain-containing protein [Myxococcales bacterium]